MLPVASDLLRFAVTLFHLTGHEGQPEKDPEQIGPDNVEHEVRVNQHRHERKTRSEEDPG